MPYVTSYHAPPRPTYNPPTMSDDFCPLPSDAGSGTAAIRRMLSARRIAIVGLSDNLSRPSSGVAHYLVSAGREIVPVNPKCRTVMGLQCYPSLEAVPGKIDLVDVFRRSEFCPDVARSAVAVGAKGLWLQSGVVSPEAEAIARNAGLDFVQDRCIKVSMISWLQES
jgi:predicted CoA-binding protein